MVEHDANVTALREYIAGAFDAIDRVMTAMGEVRIVGRGRTFEPPPGPWIDQRFFELAEELLDLDLPADRLLAHALGLEEALRKLRVAATLWVGLVVGHAAGLNRRTDDWASTMTAMGVNTTVTLASVEAFGSQLPNDPASVRALVLDAPHGPPVLSVLTGTKRTA